MFASTLGPSAASVLVVYLFIGYLREERSTLLTFFQELHKEHIEQRRASQQSIDRMVAITEQNISATNHNSYAIERLSEFVSRQTPRAKPIEPRHPHEHRPNQ